MSGQLNVARSPEARAQSGRVERSGVGQKRREGDASIHRHTRPPALRRGVLLKVHQSLTGEPGRSRAVIHVARARATSKDVRVLVESWGF